MAETSSDAANVLRQKPRITCQEYEQKTLEVMACVYLNPEASEGASIVSAEEEAEEEEREEGEVQEMEEEKVGVVGACVDVAARTMPGVNKPGGRGWVVRTNDSDCTVDVKFVLGGSETSVPLAFVTSVADFIVNAMV